MIKDIAFVAYAVNDMPRARKFYEGFLGLNPNGEFDKVEDPAFVEYNIGNGTLALGYAPDMWKPSEDGASAALEVDNFDEMVEMVKSKNIPIVQGPHDFPSCRMIVLQDPDKNKITLHQKKK